MSKFNPYALKKPCANCPFLKDEKAAIGLSPGRRDGIIADLIDGTVTGFSCHKTLHKEPSERWRDVVGSGGRHQVSDRGRVRSVLKGGKILSLNFQRYWGLSLKWGDKNVRRNVHVLVLTAFDRPPAPGEECRHLDGDTNNNHRQNLKWGTKAEQGADKKLHGKGRGQNQHLNKLTEAQVREIKSRLSSGELPSAIALIYGVSRGQIYNIKNGLSWSWLDNTPATVGWTEDDGDGEEVYQQSGKEQQCAGALAVLEKINRPTQLVRIMERMGLYDREQYTPMFELVIDYDPD